MADGELNIPKVGAVPKKVLIPVVAAAVAFVGWRYWKARQDQAAGDSTIQDGDFGAIDTSIPDTLNPFPDSFSGGGSGSSSGGSSSGDRNGDGQIGPGEFTTNGDWTNYVVDKLAGDRWSSSDIQLALGLGLTGKPTTTAQQEILRAAIAVAGNPPVGSLTIVTGGNTNLTVAPSSVRVASTTQDSATITFSSVPGAARYYVYRDGTGAGGPTMASGSPSIVGGLQPNTSYTFHVAGVTASGQAGPKSAGASGKTTAYALGAAATPTITGVTRNTATAKTGVVQHAAEYVWYLNGAAIAYTTSPQFTFTGLHPNTRYQVAVVGRISGQNAGKRSATATFTTKK